MKRASVGIHPGARYNPQAIIDGLEADWNVAEDYPYELPASASGEQMMQLLFNSEAAQCNEVLDQFYAEAVAAHAQLLAKAPAYRRRALIRLRVADYLVDVARETGNLSYLDYSDQLASARKWGAWGVDIDGSLSLQWDGRAGQVKLCPDDAREEGKRIEAQYVPALEELHAAGRELRYCVFTLPNAPNGDLKKTLKQIYKDFREKILYAKKGGGTVAKLDDPRRLFPGIMGALGTIEAPLSKAGDWNVHLNLMLVSKGRPNYKAIRAAWGYNVHFDYIRGRRGDAFRRGLAEIVKYALIAISDKAEKKADGSWNAPPGLTQWPTSDFDEWWQAHKGRRRTRSWGCLYGIAKPAPRDLSLVTICGRAYFDANSTLHIAFPRLDSRVTGPARAAALDLIQGNKSGGFGDNFYGDNSRGPPPRTHQGKE